jgi:hypothetical protein
MKTTRFLIAVLILLSLVPQAFTAAPTVSSAPPTSVQPHPPLRLVQLTIINNTGRVFSMVMEGTSKLGQAKIYRAFGYTGKTVITIEPGVYVATFWGCAATRQAAKKLIMSGSRTVSLKCGQTNNPRDNITIR